MAYRKDLVDFMKENENIEKIELSTENSLMVRNQAMIEKGLRISNSILIEREHKFSEGELTFFMKKFNELRMSSNKLPDEFTDSLTCNPHIVSRAFNPNKYFEVFEKLHIDPEYELDYVYFYTHNGGEPFIYARKISETPIDFIDGYFSKFSIKKPDMLLGEEPSINARKIYLDHMEFEKSFMGFFQFGLFCVVVDRFYRHWHSCYNDRSFISTRQGLGKYVGLKKEEIGLENVKKMLAVDPRPIVKLSGSKAEIILSFFDPVGGGLSKLIINVEWPNKFNGLEEESIVKANKYLF